MSLFKRGISLLLSVVLLLGVLPSLPARAAEAAPTVIDGEFQYCGSEETPYRYTFHYDERWFQTDATVYQHDLTRMSLRVALAACDLRSLPGYENAQGYENIQALMEDLGFDFSARYSSYPRSLTEADYDNVGYSLGSKTIALANGEPCTLVMLAIRGHNYGAEWGGNFRIGSSGAYHQGFSTAANKALDGLIAYLASLEDISPNIKLWVTGYSRGGATANLAAQAAPGRIPGLSAQDVYAYCFACPQNTTDSNAGQSNIVNIVNPIDLIPRFAMTDWGFGRYGDTYYLPGKETAASYAALHAAMAREYRNILTYQGYSVSEADAMLATLLAEWDGQCYDCDTFLSDLSRVLQNRSNYVRYYQDAFMDIMAKEMGHANVDVNYAVLTITLAAILADEGTSAGIDMLRSGTFKYAHYMELCMAWLDCVDTLSPENYRGYRRIFINGPVEVSLSDNSVFSQVDENGQWILTLPADGTYTLQFSATGSGLFSFAAADYDLAAAKFQQLICYHEHPVSRGDRLTVTVSPNGELSLTLSDGSTASPAVVQEGNVTRCTVTASAGTGGSVSGGGSYLCGELAKVNAYAAEGYGFAGWYVNDQLVSRDNEYKFAVGGNTVVKARFIPAAEAIHGTWQTDLVMAASDLGVSAPDAVLRCHLTFAQDGTLTAQWETVELTALRMYFHQMFVNAYYALAYGSGITDLNAVEQFCMDSTGMGVSAYMDTLVTMEAITAAFTPADSTGAYMVSEDGRSIYLDICLLDLPSDPDIPNPFAVSTTSMSLGANSFGKPDQPFYCTRD